jgi:hypothetical protein
MSLGLIYLDMNVYADVEQAASEAQLRNALESRRLRAVCSVELVQEAAVISDVGRRTRRMRTIRRVSSVDLDPCLSSETRELVDELRAHVPGWIRHVPARARSMQLVRRWRQWLKGPFDPVHLDALATLRRDEIAKSEDPHRALRRCFSIRGANMAPEIQCNDAELRQAVLAALPGQATETDLRHDPGVYREWTEYFARTMLFDDYRVAIIDHEPYMRDVVDYIEPYLTGAAFAGMHRWARFCYLEARLERLPRRLALAGVRLGQYLRRHETGNLGDLGHCSYLRDVAVFVTSDRALAASIARVPVEIRHARICLVRSDHTDLEAGLDAALQAHDSQM